MIKSVLIPKHLVTGIFQFLKIMLIIFVSTNISFARASKIELDRVLDEKLVLEIVKKYNIVEYERSNEFSVYKYNSNITIHRFESTDTCSRDICLTVLENNTKFGAKPVFFFAGREATFSDVIYHPRYLIIYFCNDDNICIEIGINENRIVTFPTATRVK